MPDGNDLPKRAGEAFAAAKEFELYSLDPNSLEKSGSKFHGWNVLGSTLLKAEDAVKARNAVEKGRKDSNGDVAGCFSPRHGIRIVQEKVVYDLVICFACLSGMVYEGEERIGTFLTDATPGPMLKDLLIAAKVPVPSR
jgi:hypothetical protein